MNGGIRKNLSEGQNWINFLQLDNSLWHVAIEADRHFEQTNCLRSRKGFCERNFAWKFSKWKVQVVKILLTCPLFFGFFLILFLNLCIVSAGTVLGLARCFINCFFSVGIWCHVALILFRGHVSFFSPSFFSELLAAGALTNVFRDHGNTQFIMNYGTLLTCRTNSHHHGHVIFTILNLWPAWSRH